MYSISEVAEKTQLSPYVLRYYEKEGLLAPVSRGKDGHRQYTDEDLEAIGFITCMKKTGMTLKEIRIFVQLSEEGPATLKERCAILQHQQQVVLQHIEEMQQNYEKVSHKLAHYSRLLEDYETAKK